MTPDIAIRFTCVLGTANIFFRSFWAQMALPALDAQVGPPSGPVMSFLSLSPAASLVDLSRIPEPFLMWALSAAGTPQEDLPPTRAWFRRLVTHLRTPGSYPPGTTAPPPPTAVRPIWSALHPRPGPHYSWVELVASGLVVSAQCVAHALAEVFTEAHTIAAYNSAIGHRPDKVLFTFAERARASNCEAFVPTLQLDTSGTDAGSRSWSAPPRKRLAVAAASLAAGPSANADPRAVRLPSTIAREASLRNMMASVSGSWRSYQSGLRCWGCFMDACFPASPHFPAAQEHIAAFAVFFQNGDTLDQYLSHLHFGERLLQLERRATRDFERHVVRGAKKARPRPEGPAFRRDAVVTMIAAALHQARPDAARLFAVARAWLLRVQSEALPLQAAGRHGLPSDSVRWHSEVHVLETRPKLRIRITWRVRKNAPAGHSAERTCSCGPSPESQLLCGPCALYSQLLEASQGGIPAHGPVFHRLQGSAASSALCKVTGPLNLPAVWHAFRRGMAQDMLSNGSPLGEILLAGGWRSGAFLRYLSRFDLDKRAALEFATAESGDEA